MGYGKKRKEKYQTFSVRCNIVELRLNFVLCYYLIHTITRLYYVEYGRRHTGGMCESATTTLASLHSFDICVSLVQLQTYSRAQDKETQRTPGNPMNPFISYITFCSLASLLFTACVVCAQSNRVLFDLGEKKKRNRKNDIWSKKRSTEWKFPSQRIKFTNPMIANVKH